MKFLFSLIASLVAGCAHVHAPHDQDWPPQLRNIGDVDTIAFPGHATRLVVAESDSQAGLALTELIIPPRSVGAPPHVHSKEDEYFIILEGELTFLSGDRQLRAGPGDVATLTRGHLHGFWNASQSPTRVLLAIVPGNFAGFFDEVVLELRAEKAQDPAQVGAIIAALAAQRGVKVYPEKLPAAAAELLAR